VRDDGAGFDVAGAHPGAGLENLVDRLASVGGGVSIESAEGRGTRVAGWAPVAPADA
jgi:signal transduction histidine kinase